MQFHKAIGVIEVTNRARARFEISVRGALSAFRRAPSSDPLEVINIIDGRLAKLDEDLRSLEQEE